MFAISSTHDLHHSHPNLRRAQHVAERPVLWWSLVLPASTVLGFVVAGGSMLDLGSLLG